MNHKKSIVAILIGLFLLTQFIGLYVVYSYSPTTQTIINPATGETQEISVEQELPFGLESSEEDGNPNFISIVFAFVFAFAIIFVLMKYKWKFVIRSWFFLVVVLALGIAINALLKNSITQAALVAIIIATPLAFVKIFRPNVILHNLTELLIYPGIAAVFVPILLRTEAATFFGKIWPIVTLLVLISLYDAWAVWKSGIMQKMAKFQMEELRLFGGFMIPSVSDKIKKQIKRIKQKYKGKRIPNKIRKKKFKIGLAILGGGDVIFPIIAAGVFLRSFGLGAALFVTLGALAGLTGLFLTTKKGKAYPAMPYITVGIFLGMILGKLILGF